MMFKLVATICMLSSPEYAPSSVLQCHTYEDANGKTYKTIKSCNKQAEKRIETTMALFEKTRTEYETLIVKCEKVQ